MKAVARAYLVKRQVHRELLETIRADHAGHQRIPHEIAVELVDPPREGLTPREIDVLRLIASGNANKDIANHLSVGEASVKSHVANTLSKLNANDHAHAVTIFLCEPYAANSGSVKSVYGICLPVVTDGPL
jgi:DNA-binding NarL/FixJ family response regulator